VTSPTTGAQTTIQAAGAVVWRVRGRKLEVLLVHRPKYDDWSWPKGKLEDGEAKVACAAREVAEETGLHVALGQPLPTVRYRDSNGRAKVARYWAAQEVGDGAQSVQGREDVSPASAAEIDGTRWVDVATARDLLSYVHDRDPLGALVDQWQDERLRTWTMVVVRHARARKRSAWDGGEATRPLTPVGEVQARQLVPMLAAYGVEDVITSPWERCAATVRPYLEATGVGAELRPELTEDAHAKRKRPVRELVDHEMTHRDVPVAVCTHRPVLPTVVEEIARRTPHRIMNQVPESDPWLKPAGALEKHRAPQGA
jgi:8-oxo-dGTP diphosphatase